MTSQVRVVVVNYRATELTLRCAEALLAGTHPRDASHLVVVDNGSGDGSFERLATALDGRAIVLDAGGNGGFGAGCNVGIAHPGHWDAVALLNNDSVPAPDWLERLVAAWRTPAPAEGPVGAVAAKVLLDTGGPTLNSVGCDLWPGGFNADRGDGTVDDGRFDVPTEVFGWSGAAALLDRRMLDDVGVFDERFFLYYEDVDLVWRGRRRGWSVVTAPDAVTVHDRGASTGRGNTFTYHDTRNRLLVLALHAPVGSLVRALAVQLRLLLDAEPMPRSVRLHAIGGALRRLPRALVDRRRLSRRATVPSDAIVARWQREKGE